MRYRTILFAVFLGLISTPVIAQEISPIIVDTIRSATPTTVITGQQFTQTYLVRFIDLTDQGEMIEVKEAEISKVGTLGDFEVLKLEKEKVVPPVKEFTEHWWYLTYTLRIINSEKGPKVIPPLPIPWVLVGAGQDPNDSSLKVNSDMKTDPVHINYVTTIPAKETSLDIRDSLSFGNFSRIAFWLKVASWSLGIVPLSLFVLALARRRRSSPAVQDVKTFDFADVDAESISDIEVMPRDKALRELKKMLRNFHKLNPSTCKESDLFSLERRLSHLLSNFLRAELSLSLGATPTEMISHAGKNLKDLKNGNLVLELARINAFYDNEVQRGEIKSCTDFILNTQILNTTLGKMSWYSRIVRVILRRK